MKWYEREYGFKGQPYRYFMADIVWSAVAVSILAFVMILMGAGLPAIAGACAVATLLFARMVVRRVTEERAVWGRVPAQRGSFAPLATSRTLSGT